SEQVIELLEHCVIGFGRAASSGNVPVFSDGDVAVAYREPMRRRNLPNARERRLRRDEVAERQVTFERTHVRAVVPVRTLRDGFDLAGEVEDAVQHGVVERLLADAIASEE